MGMNSLMSGRAVRQGWQLQSSAAIDQEQYDRRRILSAQLTEVDHHGAFLENTSLKIDTGKRVSFMWREHTDGLPRRFQKSLMFILLF